MRLKSFFVLLITVFLTQPSFAKDKGVAKVGPVTLKSVTNSEGGSSVAAANVGDQIQISLGGAVGLSSGVFTIFLPASANFEKGAEFSLTSTGNDTEGTAILNFLVQRTQIRGSSAVITGYATNNDSAGSGKLKVIAYDPDTKELKFNVTGKVAPYTRTVNLASKDITKPIPVTANIVVTLP